MVSMAEARERSEWSRASTVMALIANANRDPKKTRAFKPADFDPYAQRVSSGATSDLSGLRAVFGGKTKEACDGDTAGEHEG